MKSLRLFLLLGGVLIVIYIAAQLNRPKAVDWKETFNSNDKIPYGTYILYHRLNDIFPNAQITALRQPVYNVLVDDSVKNASYIIICGGIEFSKPDYEQLIKYIKQGNDVFIAAVYMGALFNKNLHVTVQRNFSLLNDSVSVGFFSRYLNPKKQYSIGKGAGESYFNKFDTLRAVVLGETASHKANFLKYTFGNGSLYLASDPKFFSNYSLLKPDGAEYAATALSFIKGTKRLIWDEYYTQGDAGEQTLMRVFLKNPILQWAYYIAIFSLLLFVVFEIKRRQRVIPVIEPLPNSTLEFVTVVGQVYYEKRNNVNIAQKKILYLLADLRDEYQLKTNKLDDEFIDKLASKLGLDNDFAIELVNYIRFISVQDSVSDRELIELNKLIEQLYIQSR